MFGVLKAIGLALSGEPAQHLDVAAVHAAHADYVWSSLYRLGVRAEDLPDMLQEVFVVVHRRAHTYDGRCRLRTWLYGICLGVAANYRRRAFRKQETLVGDVADDARLSSDDPEKALERVQAQERLSLVLEGLTPEKRAVFVMFELEGLSCEIIAEELGVPIGTVYSRLHGARKQFAKVAQRFNAREGC